MVFFGGQLAFPRRYGKRQQSCGKKENTEVFCYHKACLLRRIAGIRRRLSERFPSITIHASR